MVLDPIGTAREFIEQEMCPSAGFVFHYGGQGPYSVTVEEWQCDGRGRFVLESFENYRLTDWLAQLALATHQDVDEEQITSVAIAIHAQLQMRHELNELPFPAAPV